jgi:hypothetical protein
LVKRLKNSSKKRKIYPTNYTEFGDLEIGDWFQFIDNEYIWEKIALDGAIAIGNSTWDYVDDSRMVLRISKGD